MSVFVTDAKINLLECVCSDTLNVVASDHRPFTIKQKAMGKDDFTKIPCGLPGIQDRMSVIWEKGVVCICLFVFIFFNLVFSCICNFFFIFVVISRLEVKLMKIASLRSQAQMQPRSTTSTPGKAGSFQEQMLMWWSGTLKDPSMKPNLPIYLPSCLNCSCYLQSLTLIVIFYS